MRISVCIAALTFSSFQATLAFSPLRFGVLRPLFSSPSSFRSNLSPQVLKMSTSSGRRLTAEDVLKNPKWPATWPYSAQDFARADESEDEFFYDAPR